MSMYETVRSSGFRRDVKRCQRQDKDMEKFKVVHEMLVAGKPLPEKYRDHALTGNWKGYRECHIAPDWLLIYCVRKQEGTLEYIRMGSHAELLKK